MHHVVQSCQGYVTLLHRALAIPKAIAARHLLIESGEAEVTVLWTPPNPTSPTPCTPNPFFRTRR